ncbi:hypothetical protein KIPB_007290 [Kipferlia bialata]|uniref:Short-chain dehydrogenase/reductase SDR n=1 Tax=Kipferlia bialata TaxID=797122 RepID=A0A9K3D036_9EUKA|nr:hypothetical protein KIPB_007290 [Kipferlia bialata]|eukprot:g7290.t1
MRVVCVLCLVLVAVAHASFDFSGEYALVSGGGSGIGLGVAENFAAYGGGVYFVGRNVTRGAEIEES